ncbi:hypothetical protein BDN72DRAFT_839917 [Pluteus cervinus]|uniref:Uncharacterized protein n=1 Tax=Pluteus cervinus TaxID=181527 RepID=A0ACD3AY51_9AGAR|nr:hypothetical protein BDN72DRAFT_839917 [Pluteus cervinus]
MLGSRLVAGSPPFRSLVLGTAPSLSLSSKCQESRDTSWLIVYGCLSSPRLCQQETSGRPNLRSQMKNARLRVQAAAGQEMFDAGDDRGMLGGMRR